MDMVEVETEMEIRWVGGQEIGEDILEPFQVEGAKGFKELCCQVRIKDIGVDVITDCGDETLEVVIGSHLFLHRPDVGFLFVLLGKPSQIVDFSLCQGLLL